VHDFVIRTIIDEATGGYSAPGIHVLYLPGDTAWDERAAARRTWDALTWLETMFGPYPWPQLTNVHRLEGGGTEFPMLIMNGSASEGLIVHETTHQYLHGILANNEWREGWMDEGFTSFMSSWYREMKGDTAVWRGTMQTLERLERADSAEIVGQPGASFSSPRIYSAMTYTKASAVFRMLRELVGQETFRQILRTFYQRHRLQHVTGADFQRVAQEVSRRDLDWFFGQWIERTDKLDYGIAGATTRQAGGRWRTRVEVVRAGEAWMPVVLRVGDQARTLDSRNRRQTVEIVTDARPAEAVLDPDWVLIDMDRSNDRAPLR
jgi:aminopeptidase N